MKLVRAFITVLVVVAVVAGGYYAYTLYNADQAAAAAAAERARIQFVQVTRGTIVATVSTNGSVTTINQVKVSFRTPGTLKEVNFRVGDAVKAGDVLAKLDSTDLELALATALTNLDKAQIKISRAR